MEAWGVSPNQLSYNTIMDAYAREGNVENVVKIYNFMQVGRARFVFSPPPPPVVFFTCALAAVRYVRCPANAVLSVVLYWPYS